MAKKMILIIFCLTLLAHARIRLELENEYETDRMAMKLLHGMGSINKTITLSNVPVNMGYTAKVYIGNSKQMFKVVVDTGSSDLWVPSVDCTSMSCKRHIRYDPSLSSTASSTGREFSMKYGTGSVMGHVFNDQIEFAGFKLYDHPIGTVVKQSSYFTNKPFDGILGLGFSKISSISENSLMDRLKENGLIKRKMFSLLLTSYGDKASELLFDDVNPEHFKGNLMPVNVTSNSGFWIITLDGAKISVDGKTSLIYFRQNQAIMDTGSTMIYAPRKAADALHKRIPGAKRKWFKNHYTFPCHVVPKITLNFIIHDMQVSILPENLSLGSEDGGKTCISAISSTNENEWILGSSFLRNVYSVWDAESEEISFASLSQ